MSMKSFDKFCERMITGEPMQEKAVFDERQKVVRLRNGVIALGTYSGLTFLNTLLMECGLKWCESAFAPFVLFVPICAALFYILCAVKGALFDVKGTRAMKYTATMMCVYSVMFSVMYFPDEEHPIFVDGVLSDVFVCLLAAAEAMVLGIAVLIMCRRENKRMQEENRLREGERLRESDSLRTGDGSREDKND